MDLEKEWKKLIMKEVPEVTFISKMYKGNDIFITVKLKNFSGGRDTVDFKLEPNQKMRGQEWEYILENLKAKKYEAE
jgi:hypothetical protein